MAATTAAELPAVVKVTARLKALLERAKTVKPETTVEPPLPVSSFLQEVTTLHDEFDEKHDQSYRFVTVETACREIFYSLVNSTDIQHPAFAEIWNLLDIVLLCGDHGICTPELGAWLCEELLDSQTTQGCRIVFDYLDSRRDRLAGKDFHKKNLVFLRSCNELLRRLSRAEDAIFCGRVFFFLFQTFPLGDKSAVNLRGEFHVDNTTKFDIQDDQPSKTENGELMEVDSKTEEKAKESTPQPLKADSKAVPIKAPPKKTSEEEVLSNSELYPIFWTLQHDFSDPTRLYDRSNFDRFKKALAATITKFKKTPTVVQTKAGEEGKRGTKRRLDQNGSSAEDSNHIVDNYNPKYLTSRDLFDLELSDLAFQRHILVQALILIDFLLSLTDRAKKRLATISTPNKSMLYAFTLSDEDTKWAVSTRTAITEKLGSTAEGKLYHRMVETVLARDKNWVRWKVESCPSIVRGPVSTEQEIQARSGAASFTRPRRIPTKASGVMDLSFLDEGSGGGLEALKDPSRYAAPSIEQLIDQINMDKLDAEMAMTDDEKAEFENGIWNAKWRALRRARTIDLALLDKVESTKDLEQILRAPEPSDLESAEQSNEEDIAVRAVSTIDSTAAATVESEPRSTAVDVKIVGTKETE